MLSRLLMVFCTLVFFFFTGRPKDNESEDEREGKQA